MSSPNPKLGDWSIHYQDAWKEDACNPRFPMPLRLAFLAYGNHRANGHANFRQMDLAKALGRFDDDGTFVPMDHRNVHRAIRLAVEWGLLADGSKALCLVVPEHRVTGGPGKENEPCKRHPEHRARGRRTLRAVS